MISDVTFSGGDRFDRDAFTGRSDGVHRRKQEKSAFSTFLGSRLATASGAAMSGRRSFGTIQRNCRRTQNAARASAATSEVPACWTCYLAVSIRDQTPNEYGRASDNLTDI